MTTQNIEQTFEEYAILNAQIKLLTVQKDTMRDTITEFIKESGEDKRKTSLGTFTLTSRKSWIYPEYVTEAEGEYKVLKAKSESTGEATFTVNQSLLFKETKF